MCLCALACIIPPAFAQPDNTEIEKITANWECKWCPYEDTAKSSGDVVAGAGYVSNDSYKFGDYTGLNEKGAYFVGDLNYGYRGNNGSYSDVEAYDLGLDSRSILASGGKQGMFDAEVGYSELPKLNLDTARTPYAVSNNQTLPSTWVAAPNTSGMTDLANALHYSDIYTHRNTLDIAADYHQTQSLSYGLSFQRTTKEGYKTMGLSIGGFAGAAILAVPVDYVTDLGQVRISYRKARWQANLSYDFSNFNNDSSSIRWQNAFSTPATSPEGQAALDPDNTMQKFTLSGAYRFSQSTQASALVSMGQQKQNESFLPYTINGVSPALPRTSLDGKVNTFAGNVTVNSRFTDNFDMEAKYTQNEQDNDTPVATYNYIIADGAASSTPRENIPYSFRQRVLSVEGRYRLHKRQKFAAGYDYDVYDRTYQEVDTTEDNIIWGTYRNQVSEKWNWFLRIEAGKRTGDTYTPVTNPPGLPTENPLLRKYYMADLKRKLARFAVSYTPQSALQVSFFTDYANNDYYSSEVGLQDSEQNNYSLEFQYRFSDALNFNLGYTLTNMNSTQEGMDNAALPSTSWIANNDDTVNVVHLGVLYHIIKNKLKLGFDYTYADSEGDITFATGQTAYPALTSTRNTFKIYGDYTLNEKSILNVTYLYEDYSEANWAIDGVAPDTISNVLSMGEISPAYNIGVLSVSVRYLFN